MMPFEPGKRFGWCVLSPGIDDEWDVGHWNGEGWFNTMGVRIEPATGEKCARCWIVRTLGADPAHPTLCERCSGVLA